MCTEGSKHLAKTIFDTYAPVVIWFVIRLLIICAIVMAYAQAPIRRDMYLQLPNSIDTESGNIRTHVLKLLRNVYSQKQAGKVWANFLSDNIFKIEFKRINIDECVFYCVNLVFLV